VDFTPISLGTLGVCGGMTYSLVPCVCVCVIVGEQLPFPPEYLAPSAERVKTERKTKLAKHRKDGSGKVREGQRV